MDSYAPNAMRLPGDTLDNGAVLIEAIPWYNEGGTKQRIVLAVHPETQNYIVWYQRADSGITHHGSYHGTGGFVEALHEFYRRAASRVAAAGGEPINYQRTATALREVIEAVGA